MADTSKINPIRIDKLGEANGVASLDNSGKVPESQLPTKAINAVQKTGDTMTGPLIVPDVSSGSNDNTVINSKWANGLFVKKAGDTMSGDLIIKKSFPLLRGAATSDLATTDGMCLTLEGKDANNKEFARIDLYRRGSIQQSEAHLIAENSSGTKGELAVFIDDSGRILTFAPTPASTSNNTEIATTAWVRQKIQELSSSISVPVGSLSMGPVASMEGYILCDGRAISRSQYSNLFTAIGTNFGAGDGSTTFNVPDYRGCFLRMTGGDAGTMYQKQAQGLPDITGELDVEGGSLATGAFVNKGAYSQLHDGWKYNNMKIGFSASTSNSIYGAATEVRPVNYAVNYFIKY